MTIRKKQLKSHLWKKPISNVSFLYKRIDTVIKQNCIDKENQNGKR